MSADVSTIDLAREVSPEEIVRAEDEANRVVWEDRPVSVRFVSADEAAALPLRKEPVRQGRLRLIDVADFDLSACGGTHVPSTGAIGIIAVTGWERLRGGSRLSFVCGGRALRALRVYRDSVSGSIRLLSVLPEELPAAIERAQGEAKDLRRTLRTLQEALAGYEAQRLLAEATISNGVRLVVRTLDGWDAGGLKTIASACTAGDAAVAALFSQTPPLLAVVARSANVQVDAQAVLRQLVQRFGGRGGGEPDLSQGGGLNGAPQDVVSAARTLITEQLTR
jgi:alanyl-tRNA synthetase